MPVREGALDVVTYCWPGGRWPFDSDGLYKQITAALSHRNLPKEQFDKVPDFVATGGHALAHYTISTAGKGGDDKLINRAPSRYQMADEYRNDGKPLP